MRPVVQEDRTGCGLASVAALAGVSYPQVKRVAGQLGIDVLDSLLWSDIKYIRTLLTYYGLSASPQTTPFKSWNHVPSPALLAIKWHRHHHRAFWHWVIFWEGPEGPIVLDPKRELHTNLRTDFGRIKPKWYLTIIKQPSYLTADR